MAKSKNFGIKAILKIYDIKLLLNGAKYPFAITIIISIAFLLFGQIDKDVLIAVVDLVLSIIPSLLGFVLSGYALLIGFGNIEVIAKRKKTDDTTISKPTLYQKVSTVFAVGLIMQIILLVFAFGLKLVLKLEIPCLFDDSRICETVNYGIFILLVFGLLYVTVMIKDLVVNIFNFSQVQHFFINSPQQNDKDQKEK